MKKFGILHPELARVIAALGHGDKLVIADAGLPVPRNVLRIDLAVAQGVPAFIPVLTAVLGEMKPERALIATELAKRSPAMQRQLRATIKPLMAESVDHEIFKMHTADAVAVVRTGEFTPYANIILYAGVVF